VLLGMAKDDEIFGTISIAMNWHRFGKTIYLLDFTFSFFYNIFQNIKITKI
jgi:uncharacterized protein involved in tellurium resistance